ncbi:gephyrin-like molybdotransferase Glp [Marichromatium sp. AB31]|uniref:molybdopterin molybdotransferase MoeA n=1 Tax=Marichromatium sp. AB31 TaxID=2483362 RepID=UPI000F3BDB8B|nr:gephyrin-like molybdotransferase Glp [Marichromatium sp. AB31]RNE92173.1 molybdopterin molybdenumtransferase MoeA [Marichromatium sp. AB31]
MSASCPASPRALSLDAALARLLEQAPTPSTSEPVALAAALGRVLAAPLRSPLAVPHWDHSAMDGYALRHADLAAAADGWLPIGQRITAGTVGAPLAPGSAARIFTGAPVPEGADTVVMQEQCERDGERVRIPPECKAGGNIRRAGEDFTAGTEVIAAGTRLGPQHLGLAASLGLAELMVRPRLRVAICASGDELVAPGAPLGPGQIYDSNRLTLGAMLTALGCEVIDLGRIPDDLEATCATLARGADAADLVIASGGVSVGEEDHVRPAVERIGTLALHQVAIRPGKPVAFGRIADTPFFGSPGNPVSLFVTCALLVRPLVLRMQGVGGDLAPRRRRLPAAFAWPRPDKRREFHRARLVEDDSGQPRVEVFASRSSASLRSLVWADGLVDLAPGVAIAPGDPVEFIPFTELLH